MGAVILTSNHDIPSNLDDAISIIKRNTPVEEIESIKAMTEEKFSSLAHFGFGMRIRNTWSLWWSTALAEQYRDKNYPQTKPAIVEFFNNLGIYHADDMSGIVVTTFYRDINGIDINLNEQIQRYIDFWANQAND